MEMTYNVNPQEQPVNAKICDYGAEEVVSLDNVSQVQTGTSFDVKGKTFAHIRVDGEFEASVKILGYFSDKSGDYEYATVYEQKRNDSATVITGVGGYFVDLKKYQFIRARVSEYTSGSVTVTMTLFTKPNAPTAEKERNKQIAYSHAVPVDGGAYAGAITDARISAYPFQYVAVRADSKHNFRVSLYYKHTDLGSHGITNSDLFALNMENSSRGVSEWIEARGNIVDVYIYNDSGEAHTYDVYLYGVG